MKNAWLLAVVAVMGCGVSETEVTDLTDVQGQEGSELSTTSRTYVTFTHDFRKCASPMCGGYFVTDVNRVNPAPRYVSAIDFSKSGLDDATIQKALEGGAATVLRGKLGAEDVGFSTRPFVVSDAWRGMPGVTATSTDSFYLTEQANIQCIKAPCPSMKATRLNAGGSTLIHETDVTAAALPRVDTAWLSGRVELRDAIVTGHFTQGKLISGTHEKVLTASQVFVKLAEAPGPCPLAKMPPCPTGQVRSYTRDTDRCVLPHMCVPAHVCTQFVMACPADYTLISWVDGVHACPARACDPTFSIAPE
jgi:hypothetical protein